MLHITIIERKDGFKSIVEDRAAKTAYVCPIYMDSYRDALKIAKDAASQMGGADGATIERKTYAKFAGLV